MSAYTYEIAGIPVASGHTFDDFLRYYVERKEAMAKAEQQIKDRGPEWDATDLVHDIDCECSTCVVNDALGYDADVTAPSQYCKHGTFMGSWWGPDYICGLCEEDYDPAKLWAEERAAKQRIAKVSPREKVGNLTLREIVKRTISSLKQKNEADKRFIDKRLNESTAANRESAIRYREYASGIFTGVVNAYASLMTDVQQEWFRSVIASEVVRIELAEYRAAMDTLNPKLREMLESQREKRERVRPIDFYRPRVTIAEGMTRLDAMQAWIRGLERDALESTARWVDWICGELVREGTFATLDGQTKAAMIQCEWDRTYNGGKPTHYPYFTDDMTTGELLTTASGLFWYRIDMHRQLIDPVRKPMTVAEMEADGVTDEELDAVDGVWQTQRETFGA